MFNNGSALSIFQLRYKIVIYFADRQESRRGPAPVRGPAVEKHWFRAGVGKLSSRRAALTIQKFAGGRIDHSRVGRGPHCSFKSGRGPVLKILQ